jgi:nucleotide-binding universal stress UspA family protein
VDSILCCIRGGEASIETQKRSVALAKELNKELVFFMAYDVEFMAHANYALHADIVSGEMAEMCDFLLNMAVERAQAQGVKARSMVRFGSFAEQIREVVAEISPALVVLGHPGPEEDEERLEELQSLCRALQAELKVEFRILPEIEMHHPE